MMSPHTRLKVCAVMILLSGLFLILILQNPQLANAVTSAYIALMLTAILLVQTWRKS